MFRGESFGLPVAASLAVALRCPAATPVCPGVGVQGLGVGISRSGFLYQFWAQDVVARDPGFRVQG